MERHCFSLNSGLTQIGPLEGRKGYPLRDSGQPLWLAFKSAFKRAIGTVRFVTCSQRPAGSFTRPNESRSLVTAVEKKLPTPLARGPSELGNAPFRATPRIGAGPIRGHLDVM